MKDAVMCSYQECTEDPVTTLQINGEEKPSCQNHLETLAEKHQDQEKKETDGTKIPVATNGEDQAAWINTTEKGNTYLSVKIEDGKYINLFPDNMHLQISLNEIHEAQKQQ